MKSVANEWLDEKRNIVDECSRLIRGDEEVKGLERSLGPDIWLGDAVQVRRNTNPVGCERLGRRV